ncbi:MAG: GDP-L-fucose synthase family protein [bacterium]
MKTTDKIYVAGHNGLVGSAIVKTLKNKGYTNIIGRELKELDLRDPHQVDAFFEVEQPAYVFLAAAKVGGIVANNTYRGEFIYENLMIQNNVIHSAYKNKVKKLLFLGSTCIYPKEAPQPMKENALLTSPLEYTNEPYAIAKIAGIKMCESYNLQYGTNFLSVMPTNLYGPNDNFDLEKSHVLPALLRKIHLGKCLEDGNWDAFRADLKKRPIESINDKASEKDIIEKIEEYGIRTVTPSHNRTFGQSDNLNVQVEIWGSGKPRREFLWSEEMADACVHVMQKVDFEDVVRINSPEIRENLKPETRNPKSEIRNTHINIGTGKEVSIKQLAEQIKEKVGFNGELYFNTSKPDGTLRKLTDPSKLHSLGWHHKIEIDEGIERMYEWYLGEQR